ncbi:MAG: right-handed parallel beta-helix repeat-containing protein [Tahibacter sp.]
MKGSTRFSRQKDLLLWRSVCARALGCALLIGSAHAHAHVFCVSTASELQNALTASSDGGMYNGEDDFVHLVKGTYKVGSATGNGPFHYRSSAATGQILVIGGYNASCTAQTKKASLTVLDGNGAAQVLSIRRSSTNVVVINLTIQNGETSDFGGGMSINFGSGDNSGVDIEDNIIRNNHTSNQAGGMFVASGGGGNDLYVTNNVITGNSADDDLGAGEVIGNTEGSSLYNNTVTRNTASAAGGRGGLYYGGSATIVYISNNIFWNNTSFGLYLGSGLVRLEHNDIGTLGGVAPLASSGNLSLNPDFVDSAGGDFHLAGNSPLLAAVPQAFHSIDPDGMTSASGGRMDIGAYYETIFTDGLDGD